MSKIRWVSTDDTNRFSWGITESITYLKKPSLLTNQLAATSANLMNRIDCRIRHCKEICIRLGDPCGYSTLLGERRGYVAAVVGFPLARFSLSVSGVNLMQFKLKIPAFIYRIRMAEHASAEGKTAGCNWNISYMTHNMSNKTFVCMQQQDMLPICSKVKMNNVWADKDLSTQIVGGDLSTSDLLLRTVRIKLCMAPVADRLKSLSSVTLDPLIRCHTYKNTTHSYTIW